MRDRRYLYAVFVAVVFSVGLGLSEISAQESKVPKGLHFNVPDGWPIEKRGGGFAPVPVEEYVLRRFQEIQGELDSLRGELTSSIEALRKEAHEAQTKVSGDLKTIDENMALLRRDMGALQSDTVNDPDLPDQEGGGRQEALKEDLEALRGELSRAIESLKEQVNLAQEEKFRRLLFDIGVLEEKIGLLSEEIRDLKR